MGGAAHPMQPLEEMLHKHRIQAVWMLIHRQRASRLASSAPGRRRLLACLVERYKVASLTLLLYHQCPRRWQALCGCCWPPHFPSMGRRWLLEQLSPDTTLCVSTAWDLSRCPPLALHESPRPFGCGNLLPNVWENRDRAEVSNAQDRGDGHRPMGQRWSRPTV
jgi:hypothetical protein